MERNITSYIAGWRRFVPQTALLVAFLVSVGLWLYLKMSSQFTTTANVPLRVTTSEDTAIELLPRSTLNVRVSGSGWGLFSLYWLTSPLCNLDLSGNNAKEGAVSVTRSQLLQSILLPSGVVAEEIFPDSLLLTLGKIAKKYVHIKPVIRYSTREGFVVMAPPRCFPDSVLVSGSRRVLDTLSVCFTDTVIFKDLFKQTTVNAGLQPGQFRVESISPSNGVAVTVTPELGGERTIYDIPVVLNGESGAVVFPAKVAVTLRGSVERLSSLDIEALKATVTVNRNVFRQSNLLKPTVPVPGELEVLKTEPEFVRIAYRQPSTGVRRN